MEYLAICRLLLFCISSMGLWEYFRRRTKISVYFLPAFTICLEITVLFCAGILNCLEMAVFLMFATGIVLIVHYLYVDFKGTIHAYLNEGYIFLIVAFCLIVIASWGQSFTEYDNFSHWALVVKNMIQTDRYPSFADALIVFKDYPLGSASYVYFFSKIVSCSEAAQMAAQSLMMLCFVLPIFKYVEKYKTVSCIYVLLFSNSIFCYYILITNLSVDTLLPLQGIAMLFFIFSECLVLDAHVDTPGGGIYIIRNSILMHIYSN